MYPIEVSKTCYLDIEEWLEEIYQSYPFHRIFRDGARLGYRGFIENHDLEVEEIMIGVIELRIISKTSREVRHVKTFDKNAGETYSGETQGNLF